VLKLFGSTDLPVVRVAEHIRHYHKDRTHLGLGKQTPEVRTAAMNTLVSAKVVSTPQLGGLHHRYDLDA